MESTVWLLDYRWSPLSGCEITDGPHCLSVRLQMMSTVIVGLQMESTAWLWDYRWCSMSGCEVTDDVHYLVVVGLEMLATTWKVVM